MCGTSFLAGFTGASAGSMRVCVLALALVAAAARIEALENSLAFAQQENEKLRRQNLRLSTMMAAAATDAGAGNN